MQSDLIALIDDSQTYEPITLEKMQDMLAHKKGAKIVTIITLTNPDLVKKNPFSDNLMKLSRVNGIVNYNYKNAVNRQRKKEGNETVFEPKPRKWGQRLDGLPFVHHLKEGVSKLYLEIKVERSLGHVYIDTLNTLPIPDQVMAPYLKEKKKTKSQDVENEVVNRDYDVQNILAICLDGKNYYLDKE